MHTRYETVSTTTISWFPDGTASGWKYQNPSRPSWDETEEDPPADMVTDHPKINATQQAYGRVVGVVDPDDCCEIVVAVDFDDQDDPDWEPDYWVCPYCIIAIANDDYSGMDEEQENATREGITRLCEKDKAYLVVESHEKAHRDFSHHDCDCCGGLAGERYGVMSLPSPSTH